MALRNTPQGAQIQVRGKGGIYESTNLMTLDDMPFADYAKFFSGRIKDAEDHDRYDTLRIEAASAVAKGPKTLFNVPAGSDGKTATGTVFTKDAGDTNMVEGNRMEYGSVMIVESVQCQVIAPAREFAALSAGGPTDLTPAAAGTIAASNTVIGLGLGVNLTFTVGDNVKASGPLAKFPCAYVFSGAVGGDTDEGFVQIGMGRARPLREIVILKPMQNFAVALDFLRATTVPQSIQIRVYLSGVLLRAVS